MCFKAECHVQLKNDQEAEADYKKNNRNECLLFHRIF